MDRGEPIVQTLSLLRHRQRYLTHYAKYFMELLFQVAGEMERAQVSRVVPECPDVYKRQSLHFAVNDR